MNIQQRKAAITKHYCGIFGEQFRELTLPDSEEKMGPGFSVLEFCPNNERGYWAYGTCCMSQPDDRDDLELHMLSFWQNMANVELLSFAAYYHQTSARLGLGHTVNLGRPWTQQSNCDHGLISLPYPFGPKLEVLCLSEKHIHCLWLLPITLEERDFKAKYGLDALEQRFESAKLNYLDPTRKSVV
jgi:hypothetical protein